MRLAMAIRTLIADKRESGVYFAGGGIVANSIPQLEVEETEWKSLQILNNLGECPSHWAQPEAALRTLAENWSFSI
jgi:anthranilate/para-aminobenzoate synthase component I